MLLWILQFCNITLNVKSVTTIFNVFMIEYLITPSINNWCTKNKREDKPFVMHIIDAKVYISVTTSPLTLCPFGSTTPLCSEACVTQSRQSHHGWVKDNTGHLLSVCHCFLWCPATKLLPEHPRVTMCNVLSLGTGSVKHLYRPAAPRGDARILPKPIHINSVWKGYFVVSRYTTTPLNLN